MGEIAGHAAQQPAVTAHDHTARPPARDGTVGALLHGLGVLDMFTKDRPVIGIAEVARELGVHRSTASRLAGTPATGGYLEVAGEQGRYRLAAKLAVLGEVAAAGSDLRGAALPALRDLVSQLGETGHLGILEGTEAVTVADVRAGGYAVDLEELEPHLCCVAAPVFGRDAAVVASISVSGPASRLRDPATVAATATAVRETARQISARLGAPPDIPGWPRIKFEPS